MRFAGSRCTAVVEAGGRVVDEVGHPSELVVDGLRQPCGVEVLDGQVGQVGGERGGAATGRLDADDRLVQRAREVAGAGSERPGHAGDGHALGLQALGDGCADAPACTGHDRHVVAGHVVPDPPFRPMV